MSLILTVRNAEALEAGAAGEHVVQGELIVIGRSRNCDWPLADPANAISSRHCEIRRDGDAWLVKDISTNGTFLNDAPERLAEEHRIAEGDLIRIGHYEIVAAFAEAGEEKTVFSPAAPVGAAPPPSEPAPPPVRESEPEPGPAPAPPPPPEAPEPPEAVPDNVTVMWDSLADINEVDWARGGFGVKDAAGPTSDDLLQALAQAAGLDDAQVAQSPDLAHKAGALLKRLVAGLLIMVEARARAKAQMGAEMTGLELHGNNPIKFARTPDQALAQLLSPAQPGFMEADRAVEDAFLDLQSHQVATLKAIPGALRATLDRFSPGSIRRRASRLGFMAKILPAFRDAALWRNYEREFVAVKKESDEAFMEVFAREFRKAYERQLRAGIE
jgi:type VI secretion system FHA domain protein